MFCYFNFRQFRRSGVSCSDWGRRRNPETKVLDFVERWIKFALPQINILTVLWFDSKIYIANLSVAGETWEKLPGQDTSFAKSVGAGSVSQINVISLNKTKYLKHAVHFKLLKLFFFKTWFHVRKMAIVSVSSHSLSTRIDCSVFSLRRSKSSLMAIRAVTGTFI